MWLVKVWDVETGRQLRIQQGHQAWVTDLLYSVAASLLFSCSLDGNVLVWSDKGKLLQVLSDLWYVFFCWCYLKCLQCCGLDIHALKWSLAIDCSFNINLQSFIHGRNKIEIWILSRGNMPEENCIFNIFLWLDGGIWRACALFGMGYERQIPNSRRDWYSTTFQMREVIFQHVYQIWCPESEDWNCKYELHFLSITAINAHRKFPGFYMNI